MIPVVEMFTSIQGEGKYTGIPSHFIRVNGCNLRCVFKDSICDTPYSSFKPEDNIVDNVEDLYVKFCELAAKNPSVKHIVITGGEPLLYKKDLEKFIDLIYTPDKKITIETNGTLPILDPTLYRSKIALYSVSPKLSSSVGKAPGTYGSMDVTKEMINRHNKTRINIKNLIDIVLNSNDYQFKFVYSGPGCVDEILDLYDQMDEEVHDYYSTFKYHVSHPNTHTMLMPEGINNDQLAERRKEIADICIKKGWTMTDREHIIIWGSERMR